MLYPMDILPPWISFPHGCPLSCRCASPHLAFIPPRTPLPAPWEMVPTDVSPQDSASPAAGRAAAELRCLLQLPAGDRPQLLQQAPTGLGMTPPFPPPKCWGSHGQAGGQVPAAPGWISSEWELPGLDLDFLGAQRDFWAGFVACSPCKSPKHHFSGGGGGVLGQRGTPKCPIPRSVSWGRREGSTDAAETWRWMSAKATRIWGGCRRQAGSKRLRGNLASPDRIPS